MTRILVVTNMYPPHHLGGYELECRDVVEGLRERGHDVEVLTTTMRVPGVSDPPGERSEGIRRDLTFYWDDHRLLSPPWWRRLAMERGNQRAIAEAIARHRPDVVSAWNMGAMSLGILTAVVERRIPLVLMICDEWPWYAPNLDAWMRLFAGRPRAARIVRAATGVPTSLPDLEPNAAFVYVSEMIRRSTETKSRWPHPLVSGVAYSGIDTREFPVPDASPPAEPWRWKLLYVGRLDERKGVHVLIEAMAQLPAEATLDVYGRGEERYAQTLRAQVDRLGIGDRVSFGVSERADLRRLYAAADVFVFPVTWEEPFGLVPIEAMACGTPVVATGTGGSGEFLVDGGNALLVPPDDPRAIADAVERLAGDPALREKLAEGGLRTARELNVTRLVDVVEAWHVSAVSRFASGHPPSRRFELA